MTLLSHCHTHDAATVLVPCESDAIYWVITDGGAQLLSCGPHLHLMLGQYLTEGVRVADEEPEPGPNTKCQYVREVTR